MKTQYKQEYRQSFVGGKGVRDWERMPADAEAFVKYEPTGLRIVLPTGHPDRRDDTGVVRGLAIQGDFELTLTYEILKGPEADDAGKEGTRLGMTAGIDRADNNMANVSHVINKRDYRTAWMAVWIDPMTRKARPKAKGTKAAERFGRLRLVRTGAELAFLAADGESEDFEQIEKLPFGREPLQFVSIGASTGGDKASLDAKVIEFYARAEVIPGMSVIAAEAPPPEVPAFIKRRKDAEAAALPPWILAAAGGGVFVLGLGIFWFARRSRRATAPTPAVAAPPPVAPVSATAAAFLVVACPQCQKSVRAKAEHAGKKVRCPSCGTAVPLPNGAPAASAEGGRSG